ncbi:ACP S-malonyltransferase [Fundidesulfovibrio magnetotacticus]|uniref:ACP S-malonyltransferase n=1 Tax=Fundidesulfovibrio magnetotacticus TaxID=2730080 RepID=UPI001563330D|nr:ACP S-malonyltransferase [Fundidesulfovibrio magnetotacticus]
MTPAQAVLFPGQGSQEKGMGRGLAEAVQDAMDLWKLAEKASGLPLREIYWDGDDAAMADTRNLQPAMTAVTLGCWLAVRGKLAPAGFAGHSLGEYAALAASGALPVEQVLELTSLRGRLMAEAGGSDGAMAAVLKVSLEGVEDIVARAAQATGRTLIVANYNTPGQYVISGHREAVDQAAGLCKEAKGRAVPLAVSGAFHSPLMAEAAAELEKVLAKADWRTPSAPVFANVTGLGESNPEKLRELLARQMTSSVRWIDTMTALYEAGARTFVELGPKGVLTKMVKPCLEGREDAQAVNLATREALEGFTLP